MRSWTRVRPEAERCERPESAIPGCDGRSWTNQGPPPYQSVPEATTRDDAGRRIPLLDTGFGPSDRVGWLAAAECLSTHWATIGPRRWRKCRRPAHAHRKVPRRAPGESLARRRARKRRASQIATSHPSRLMALATTAAPRGKLVQLGEGVSSLIFVAVGIQTTQETKRGDSRGAVFRVAGDLFRDLPHLAAIHHRKNTGFSLQRRDRR
jgi:hypothetical protein